MPVPEGLQWSYGEEDLLLILTFCGHASAEDTRVIAFCANSLFHSLTAGACPWLSKSVTMRCSLPGTLAAMQILFMS